MTFVQAMLLALLQGASELFPISSLGHTVIVPALLGWPIDRSDPSFLAFIVALHLGTAVALLIFYRAEWGPIVRAVLDSVIKGHLSGSEPERIGWLLVAGTIPVAVLGVFFEKPVRSLFGSTAIVGGFLILNAGVMFAGEWLKSRSRRAEPLADLPLPAVWRSGPLRRWRSSRDLAFGRLHGRRTARRTLSRRRRPLFISPGHARHRRGGPSRSEALRARGARGAGEAAAGAVLAGITAYASVAFLTRYFKSNDLRPFGWYCLIVGALCCRARRHEGHRMKLLAFGLAAVLFRPCALYLIGVAPLGYHSSTASLFAVLGVLSLVWRGSRKARRRRARVVDRTTFTRAAGRIAAPWWTSEQSRHRTIRDGTLPRYACRRNRGGAAAAASERAMRSWPRSWAESWRRSRPSR